MTITRYAEPANLLTSAIQYLIKHERSNIATNRRPKCVMLNAYNMLPPYPAFLSSLGTYSFN